MSNNKTLFDDLPDPEPETHWFNKEPEIIYKSVKTIDTRARDEFQRAHTAKEIVELEAKFLDKNLRTFDEHPAKALTPRERETYAQYLETKGEFMGAESFRKYK